jgi:hypothetical protein
VAEPYTMVVELGKAREFAKAVSFHEPIEEGSPVPVSFLMASSFWAGPGSDLWPADRDLSRMLHGQQEFVFHGGPIRVGETLICQPRFGESYEKAGQRGGVMSFQELITEFRSPDGTLRAEVKTLTIETEAAPA